MIPTAGEYAAAYMVSPSKYQKEQASTSSPQPDTQSSTNNLTYAKHPLESDGTAMEDLMSDVRCLQLSIKHYNNYPKGRVLVDCEDEEYWDNPIEEDLNDSCDCDTKVNGVCDIFPACRGLVGKYTPSEADDEPNLPTENEEENWAAETVRRLSDSEGEEAATAFLRIWPHALKVAETLDLVSAVIENLQLENLGELAEYAATLSNLIDDGILQSGWSHNFEERAISVLVRLEEISTTGALGPEPEQETLESEMGVYVGWPAPREWDFSYTPPICTFNHPHDDCPNHDHQQISSIANMPNPIVNALDMEHPVDSLDIWDSTAHRNHARRWENFGHKTDGLRLIFKHGVSFKNQMPDNILDQSNSDCRTVLISNIAQDWKLRDVLVNVRSGRVVKAKLIKLPETFTKTQLAVITFANGEDAANCIADVNIAKQDDLISLDNGELINVFAPSFPLKKQLTGTATYPERPEVYDAIATGKSRCFVVENVPKHKVGDFLAKLGVTVKHRMDSMENIWFDHAGILHLNFGNIADAVLYKEKVSAVNQEHAELGGNIIARGVGDPCATSKGNIPVGTPFPSIMDIFRAGKISQYHNTHRPASDIPRSIVSNPPAHQMAPFTALGDDPFTASKEAPVGLSIEKTLVPYTRWVPKAVPQWKALSPGDPVAVSYKKKCSSIMDIFNTVDQQPNTLMTLPSSWENLTFPGPHTSAPPDTTALFQNQESGVTNQGLPSRQATTYPSHRRQPLRELNIPNGARTSSPAASLVQNTQNSGSVGNTGATSIASDGIDKFTRAEIDRLAAKIECGDCRAGRCARPSKLHHDMPREDLSERELEMLTYVGPDLSAPFIWQALKAKDKAAARAARREVEYPGEWWEPEVARGLHADDEEYPGEWDGPEASYGSYTDKM